MDFYYMDLSGPCRSVMLTAKALGIKLNKKFLNLLKQEQMNPDFIAINPQHCIPTLVDGDLKLWESHAICTYLVNKYGKDDDTLYPKDPQKSALIDRFLYFDVGTLYKRFGEYAYPVIFRGEDKPDPEKLDSLNEAFQWLNGFLEGHDFCVGNNITVADFCVVASLSTFVESGIDISRYPNICAWYERCKSQMDGYEAENGAGAKEFGALAKEKLNG